MAATVQARAPSTHAGWNGASGRAKNVARRESGGGIDGLLTTASKAGGPWPRPARDADGERPAEAHTRRGGCSVRPPEERRSGAWGDRVRGSRSTSGPRRRRSGAAKIRLARARAVSEPSSL